MSRPRTEWHRVAGKWTRSLGERGMRVRLFEKRRGGSFYRAIWLPGKGRDIACLHTKDREQAERLGRALLAALLCDDPITGPLQLGTLWERYQRENPAFLDNKDRTKRDAARRVPVLFGFFGTDCDVRTLTANDQAAYVRARLAGGIRTEQYVTQPGRTRSAESDLVLLHAMLTWAVTVRVPGGGRLLERNPLQGVRRPREKNPRRPVATWERYIKTRDAMKVLSTRAITDAERERWIKLELALVLAVRTGRRLGSLRQLRLEDVDFESAEIRWRAEADKKGYESVIPIPGDLIEELRRFRQQLHVVGGWLFAAERQPDQPMDRHLFDKWLTVAEREAGLPKLEGGLWHPYRRMWATARKDQSITDVAAAGGWRDTETLLRCYQQPDRATLLKVMAEIRPMGEVVNG